MRPTRSFVLITALVALAIAASMLWLDEPVARWFHGFGRAARDRWEPITRAGLSAWYLIPLAVLALVFRFVVPRTAAFQRCAFVFLTILWTGLLINGLKIVIGRSRPLAWASGKPAFDPFELDFATSASMPSGHAGTIAALAACLWVLFPRWRWLWVALALPIALSRVAIVAHYLSDVLAGAYVAVVMMIIHLRLLERWGMRLREPASAVVSLSNPASAERQRK